jgi:hypothetical protein
MFYRFHKNALVYYLQPPISARACVYIMHELKTLQPLNRDDRTLQPLNRDDRQGAGFGVRWGRLLLLFWSGLVDLARRPWGVELRVPIAERGWQRGRRQRLQVR